MKTFFFLVVALAAGAQAREPENLAALVDEMAVLERVLGAALEGEMAGRLESRPDSAARQVLQALHLQTDLPLNTWPRERLRTIEAEYLARQGILVSLQFSHRPSARDLPNALFRTLARTGETRLPGLIPTLEAEDFAGLKGLLDELDESRLKKPELMEAWAVELRDTGNGGELRVRPADGGPIGQEISALQARERNLQADIDKEIQRLRGLLDETTQEAPTDDIHGTLVQAVCDYAMLKSLPDDEYLTLKVRQFESPRNETRTGIQWTYYVLAKQDVVDCRHGTIDAEELRRRADVYSREDD